MHKVLVLGATGFVGGHLCQRLVRAGLQVSAVTRQRRRGQHLLVLPTLDLEVGDPHDGATLRRLVAGQDAVVNLVAILHGSARDFQQVHADFPAQLAQACLDQKVRRLVHVSALGAAPDAPSWYQRSKAAGEAALQQAAASGLALTVLRPSVIYGAGDSFLSLFARLQRLLPLVPLAGAATRFQPVWVEDVAEAVLRCLQDPSTAGRSFEACGPEVFTLAELVRLAGQAAGIADGRGRRVVGLPDGLARLQARIMEWLPGEPLMSRDNLDSMRVDNVASGAVPGLQALGITPASLSAIAPGYLGRSLPVLDQYRKTAGR
jgi:uncharacterized protein YbjT (DUF2867 family)